ncbi:MAG: MarR family transcriptional regulator [Lachnospiraceae bacterium]|nr:MarR family transcriptional regulator [Lachnospiraceae bacterium]
MNIHSSKELRRYNYLINEINASYHELSLTLGLSDSAMIVLYAICDNDGSCLLKDICRNSGVSKQTINSALRKLESENIIYLESAGMKNKKVCLTEHGKLLSNRTAGQIIEMENEIFSSWAKEDVGKYLELTERYLRDFQERSARLKKKYE